MTSFNRFQTYRRSFHFRLFVIFTVITAIITAVFSTVFIVREIHSSKREALEKARLLASQLANSIRLYLYAEDRDNLWRLASDIAQHPQVVRIVIASNDGRILVNIRPEGTRTSSTTLSETVAVTSGNLPTSAEAALTGVPTPTYRLGSVRLDLDTVDLAQRIRELIIFTCVTTLSFWLLVLFLSFKALTWMTRSFNALMQGVQTIRQGDYSARIITKSNDEPSWAAEAINELAESLKNREEQNRLLQEELVHAMKLEVQEEKQRLMAKLIQTNRMTSLGLLVSSMAHEINNPNGSIRLAGQFLTRAWKDTLPILEGVAREEGTFSLGGLPFDKAKEEISSSGETIIRNTDRIERVIHDLRAYSLGERNEFRADVNINQVVNGALAIIRAHGRQGDMTVTADLATDLPMVTGNHHQLEQVIINLLLNAIQAMSGKSGNITITTSVSTLSNSVLIRVQDEGDGIPPEYRDQLFEPFFSTRIDKGGSGLGLYISNFIISEHKGSLDITSEQGKGTTVTVQVPVTG